MAKTKLKLVGKPTVASRPGLHDYEAAHRQHIASKDWAAIHVKGDKSVAINLPERNWWKAWKR